MTPKRVKGIGGASRLVRPTPQASGWEVARGVVVWPVRTQAVAGPWRSRRRGCNATRRHSASRLM
eukprot:2153077-Amphidinium_carterae.1